MFPWEGNEKNQFADQSDFVVADLFYYAWGLHY